MTEGIQEDMKTELISVIIPVYKVEKYINRCVESVLVQNYHNIEVILVDDGSPDNCGIICDKYAETDSRIKVIQCSILYIEPAPVILCKTCICTIIYSVFYIEPTPLVLCKACICCVTKTILYIYPV